MGAPRQHIRRKVRIGVRLPANHDEIAGEVAQQNVVLDLRVLCGTSHAEAHVPVRGSQYFNEFHDRNSNSKFNLANFGNF